MSWHLFPGPFARHPHDVQGKRQVDENRPILSTSSTELPVFILSLLLHRLPYHRSGGDLAGEELMLSSTPPCGVPPFPIPIPSPSPFSFPSAPRGSYHLFLSIDPFYFCRAKGARVSRRMLEASPAGRDSDATLIRDGRKNRLYNQDEERHGRGNMKKPRGVS